MKRYSYILFIFSLYLNAGNIKEKENLNNMYKINEFQIFYTLKGKDKLPFKNQVDNNKNSIPDYIEFIGDQLNTASLLFNSIGYVNPLKSKRYRNKVSFIRVKIKNLKHNGSAFDGYSNSPLSIHISNNLSKNSFTPLHEYFHLIQNGYTMFKNRWFTEGTARWSESIFRKAVGKQKKLPQNLVQLNKNLLNKTYKTSVYWNRMAYLCSNKKSFDIPSSIKNRYIDGRQIIKDDKIYGYDFIKYLLEDFEKMDKQVSVDMKYEKYNWKEKDQKSIYNNKYMLYSIKKTLIKNCGSLNNELKKFISVIDEYLDKDYTSPI
jgi:hypothetical protein